MSGKQAVDKKRYVQIGRVCLVNYGKYVNKLVVVLNVIDARRVLVEGPSSKVPRQTISVLRLALTPIVIAIPRNARFATLNKVYTESKVDEKWSQTSWAKTIAHREARANTTDFDRFKLVIARRTVNKVARSEFNKLRKAKFPAKPKKAKKVAKPAAVQQKKKKVVQPKKKAAAPKKAAVAAAPKAKGAPKAATAKTAAKGKAK